MTRAPVATEVPLSRSSGSQAPSSLAILSETKPNRSRRPESGPFGAARSCVELVGETRNFAPDDLVVVSFPGPLDQRRAVVGKQERAAGHRVRRREIVAEGEADEGGRQIVARDQRLQAGAPALGHVARRGGEPSVRRPAGMAAPTARARASRPAPSGWSRRRTSRPTRRKWRRCGAPARWLSPGPSRPTVRSRCRAVRRPRSRRRKQLCSRRPPPRRSPPAGSRARRNWRLSISRRRRRCRSAAC